jgi:hypothetical protein
MANDKQNQSQSVDDTDADAFAILAALFIAYAAIVYYLTH